MIRKVVLVEEKNGQEKKPGRKGRRRRSRELVLQGLYQWFVAKEAIHIIIEQLHETKTFLKADQEYFSDLMQGLLTDLTELEKHIQPCLDRPFKELSPIEASILLLSTYEFINYLGTPYKAIINEAVELAKTYGGTDGHKYVNGVLDKLAKKLRKDETALPIQWQKKSI
ncbi:MAG: transcription antitermination factor NusB [Nitrosomonadaceae bacterium]|nr:transcription antitermination factor NusB [Nitrosomonadaceae bacterium]|tara:strand:- start:293 stop:799 length:507 start_codon:yes stop_codon:yes gene_type:complete